MTRRRHDPFDLIRSGDPAPREQMPNADSALGRAVRDRALSASPVTRKTPRRHVVRAILLAVLALALIAATWLITREASDPRVIGCYEAPDIEARQVVVIAPDSLDPAACESLWEDGTLTNPAIVEPSETPPLTGCVNDDGGLSVFPTDDAQLCRGLGLADQSPTGTGDQTTALNQQLLSIFAATPCLAMEAAQTQIEELLTTDTLSDWTISVSAPPTPERPCASFSLDVPYRTVQLVPIPEPRLDQ